MATINMTSCDVGAAIAPTNHASIFNPPAGRIRIEHPDAGDRLNHTCSPDRLEMLATRPNRIDTAAATAAKTPRRRTSGQ